MEIKTIRKIVILFFAFFSLVFFFGYKLLLGRKNYLMGKFNFHKGPIILDNINYGCINNRSIKIVRNDSMEPMVKPGEEFELFEGYYDCNEVKRGDVVAYNHKGNEVPIIKKVMVMGGDKVKFQGNKLIINNQILKNSAGEDYIFNEKNQKMVSLYIKNGKLREGVYLIFGDNNNSFDSRNFGAVGKNGFLGKFIIK